MNPSLAIIIPVYRSTLSVNLLVHEIAQRFQFICEYHIYLIDDGNTESVLRYLKENCLPDYTSLISLKQNYGQQNAVLCGLTMTGNYDYTAVMDDDLEHPVSALVKMYWLMKKGYDLVYGIRKAKRHSAWGSRLRDGLFSLAFHCPRSLKVSSFRIMTQALVSEVKESAVGFFYFSAAALQKPRRIANLVYQSQRRIYGKSGYNFKKKACLFFNIVKYYTPIKNLFPTPQDKPLFEIASIIPKLMILGGSNCQINAVKRAKKLGLHTIVADYTLDPPAAPFCTIHERISTFDAPSCIAAARKRQITGVMTTGTDQPVLTAAKICETLKLPGFLSVSEAMSVTNKKIMKQIMLENGIPTSPYVLIGRNTGPAGLLPIKPPYVLKPLDSQGQRGIFKLNTPSEVLSHLEKTLSFSSCEEALTEEFYKSDEITVSGYIFNRRLTILAVTDRLLYPDPVHIGVCVGHRFPSVHMDLYNEIEQLSNRLVSCFHLTGGPFYLQLLYGKQGLRVNELACRIGGAFEDVLIPWLTGFDILGAVINSSLGKNINFSPFENLRCDRIKKCAATQLLFLKPGRIKTVTPPEQIRALPFVLDAGYNYQEGSLIPTVENASARFGHAVITGLPTTIGSNVELFYQTLRIDSPDGENMVNRLYPQA